MSLTAIVDIGKSNAKLLLSDPADGRVVWSAERAAGDAVRRAGVPCRELDVAGIEAWLRASLAAAPRAGEIGAVVPIAHGAAMVVLDGSGAVLAAPDYDDAGLAMHQADYARLRDPFGATFSPLLPRGLNLGLQLLHLEREAPALFARASTILTWPQFWAWRLCGVRASEATSLGCHTDLWWPRERCFSALAEARGWARLFPPVTGADRALGSPSPEFGLGGSCRVLCGMHDSSASYHALRAVADTVVSSGTWAIVVCGDAPVERLQERRDMLANVDLAGKPVAVARAMCGREYATIAGDGPAVPTVAGLEAVLATDAMALPSFAEGTGPYPDRAGRLIAADGLDGSGLAALATLYAALIIDEMLELLGASGRIVVDGPLSANPIFCPLLQKLRPADRILASRSRGGVAAAGHALAFGGVGTPLPQDRVHALPLDGLKEYRARWREAAEGPRSSR